MVDEFLDNIKFGKRYSSYTIAAYKADLEQFSEYVLECYDMTSIDEVSTEIIRSWILQLMDSGSKATTVNRKLSSLRSYYRFLIKSKIISENPTKSIIPPKKSERLPVYITEDRMNLSDTNMDYNDFFQIRNYLIVEILYQTGIRLAELKGLKDVNIDTKRNVIKVLGKRNKERFIPVSIELLSLIKSYKKLRDQYFENNSEYLIVTNKGKQVYSKFIYSIVHDHLSKIATVSKKSPHVLRHTFATHLMNNGADINIVKELLGHSSLASTQIYTHNTISKLKLIYKQAHPRA